jgi:4-amino-4-deoxy-L-arabinose transferase-like glycosyltransferase
MPLWIYDEVRNAECAREMWERNEWVVPSFNGELRTLKPPLHYFFMFGGFELFGITEWGARFFSAVFGVLTILITYYFIVRYSSRLHALITCCLLLASTHWLFEFRMSVPDPFLIFFNTLSLFAAYAYFSEKKFTWLVVCAISFGLGILAKGPVALVLPVLAILGWLIWQKQWKRIFHWHILTGAVIMLVVAVPWYVAVHNATDGAWTRGFFLEHNVGRFSEPMEGHGGLFLIVPVFILVGLLPGSVFIVEVFKKFTPTYSSSFLRFSFCVSVAFVVFYSLSGTKLPNYPMPCYSFVALLLSYFISRAIEGSVKSKLYPFIILVLINIALPTGLYFAIKTEVETKGFENNALLLLILTAGSVISLYIYKKTGFTAAIKALMVAYTLFNLVFFNYLYPVIYKNNPLSKTIDKVLQYENVVAYKIFHPSFTFYLPERVKVFENADSLNLYLKINKALIISRQAFIPELQALALDTVAIHHDLFESSTTALLTNVKK